MNLKEKMKWKLQTFVSAPFYKWIVLRKPGEVWFNRQFVGKAEILGRGLLILPCRWDGPFLRGGRGSFWLLANGGSEFNLKEWLGSPQGSCEHWRGFSPAGENGVSLSVSLQISQSVRQWKYWPQHPPWSGEWGVGPGFQSSSGVDSPVIIPERYSLSWSGES